MLPRELGSPAIAADVLSTLDVLAPEANLPALTRWLRQQIARETRRYELRTALRALARALQPRTYLEIGVRRGWSLVQVLAECPQVTAYACDMWIHSYAGAPNPGEAFVRAEVAKAAPGYEGELIFLSGDSRELVPALVASGATFDLVTVDGDHSGMGAAADLRAVLPAVNPGGVVLLDDLVDASDDGRGFTIRRAWERAKREFPQFDYHEHDGGLAPLGIAVRGNR